MATGEKVYTCLSIPVLVLGILGNILVVISILRQRRLLKNDYYFLVLQLAFSDLGCLVVNTCARFYIQFVEKPLFPRNYTVYYCFIIPTIVIFQVAGVYIMLVISVHRYRATVHPLKPAMSRQKLKVVCGLGYIIALIVGYGIFTMPCFKQLDIEAYWRFLYAYGTFFFFFAPTLFMAVVYYKIGRALVKQNKSMKTARSNPVAQSPSSFNILKYVRNRRTYFLCLATVLCYGVGNLPVSVWFICYVAGIHYLTSKYAAIYRVGLILRIAGSCSVNPLIYGILDKKLLMFCNLCRKKKRRRQDNHEARENETPL